MTLPSSVRHYCSEVTKRYKLLPPLTSYSAVLDPVGTRHAGDFPVPPRYAFISEVLYAVHSTLASETQSFFLRGASGLIIGRTREDGVSAKRAASGK